jgi:hypothetical protein
MHELPQAGTRLRVGLLRERRVKSAISWASRARRSSLRSETLKVIDASVAKTSLEHNAGPRLLNGY